MTPAEARAAMAEHLRRITALSQVAGLLHWDQETMMPPRGAAQRAEQIAALEEVLHGLRADPRIPEIAEAMGADLPPAEAAARREALRAHARATRVPAGLAAEIARATSAAHGVWAAAKAAGRFADFAPTLARIVALKREEAACLAAPGGTPYDALIDAFEPGMTAAEIAALFGALRPGLVELCAEIAPRARSAPRLRGSFAPEAQRALSRRLAGLFGYDWKAGRLDEAEHPFSSGEGNDVRITTRIDPDNPLEAIYATIHETGHAVYEQRIDPALALTPVGAGASMGIHESQSRLFENQIGRSRAFMEWLWPAMRTAFGELGIEGPGALWRAVNRVEPGFRRTEADELHYNLHVILRFDLERALISGDLAVADLEAAWNERFLADFGRSVPHAGLGVLQDVHWAAGLFGYFPTYSLGNVNAACLWAAMGRDLPGRDAAIAAGDLSGPIDWLTARIHRHGRIHPPRELLRLATGGDPDPGPLLDYLGAKFRALFP
ncbi:MAG: carboxypeptidase M32 [Alphaproteobacteria bacterium]|nr:MAG: carboxypeptidase M32 [Alphaproteobacteria bacterium]